MKKWLCRYPIILLWVIFCTAICSFADAQTTCAIHVPANTTVPAKLRKWLTEKKWNELFPNRYGLSNDVGVRNKEAKDFYSFKAFLEAASYFPQFLAAEDAISQKRELCAFLASMAYETGGGWDEAPGGYYTWGLHFVEEKNCSNGCPQYTDITKLNYKPVEGQSYHGRGPLQISWNYNYGQFSEAFFGTKEKLLLEPALVATDPVLTFASAIWFWVTPQYPKPSCSAIMNNNWKPSEKDLAGGRLPGFGAVVNVINGGIECRGARLASTKYRYGYYAFFCGYFNVSPGENADCSSQKPFGQ